MSAKISVSCAVLCILSLCYAHENSTQNLVTNNTSNETLDSDSNEWLSDDNDLDQEASIWRLWRPFRDFRDWDIMFYADSQLTVTRRDSSLILPKRKRQDGNYRTLSTIPGRTSNIAIDSTSSVGPRPKGSVEKELVVMMFESMLDCIVESWETIPPHKDYEASLLTSLDLRTVSDTTSIMGKKKKDESELPSEETWLQILCALCASLVFDYALHNDIPKKDLMFLDARKMSKQVKQSHSRVDDVENGTTTTWWSGPDEKAVIRFRNGNMYEGPISSKCMHGEGRFQWADGTVYLGNFQNNEIIGKGKIQWKNDTWYEGEFAGNVRHGHGLYVDSRNQRSYAGGWHCGTKHGEGVIHYSKNFKNSYDGQWIHNERYGYGSREYCELSGYKGEWVRNERQGKGLMMWPNHDFYRGGWQNGVMSGYGIYIWEACYNNTMALPSINAFRGMWEKGQRNGYGVVNLGLGLGSHYKGQFKQNKKHGAGKFVTNNGLAIKDKNLFTDDNLGPLNSAGTSVPQNTYKLQGAKGTVIVKEPYEFEICDSTVGLLYHIDQALKNVDRQDEIRRNMINDYLENNNITEEEFLKMTEKGKLLSEETHINKLEENFDDLIRFEESSLRQTLKCYKIDLLNIYYKYATICNTEPIAFTPVLIRLFLWQLYYDCNVYERGLTLVEIDRIYQQNPEWLAVNPHDPFEKVYFWQFTHSLISVASKLYAKRELPGTKPDTILASAFRTFMELNVLQGSGHQRGHLVNGYGNWIPLKATYELYRSLGEPHTVRTFLRAVRRPPHCKKHPQPGLVEVPDICLPLGRNVYIFGDELTFVVDDNELPESFQIHEDIENLKLFNFGNLSSKTILKIFSRIFPNLCDGDKIMDLDIEITFFEFFEVFVTCAEESIRVKDEEMKWRKKLSMNNEIMVPPSTPAGLGSRSK